jgi:hypothetical protein
MRINNSQLNYFTGDVIVVGGLSALSASYFANTVFTTTSALSVISQGYGPALYVSQRSGDYDIASFYDRDGVEVLHIGNAFNGVSGRIGINESNPNMELTVRGQMSATGAITVSGGNSNQWNSNFTTTGNNSANWSSVYTSSKTYSANWDSVYTSSGAQSADNASVYTSSRTYSGNWDSVYASLRPVSANYDSVYTSMRSNSANYDSVYTSSRTYSANWDSVYTTVNANSGTWVFPYMVTLTPTVTSDLNSNLGTIHYSPSLSGVINASDITGRLAYNKGVMQMTFHLETPVSTGNNKRFRLEFADNAAFAASTNIISTSDNTFLSMSTSREGLISIAGNAPQQIVFQAVGGSGSQGKQANALATYTYVAGDPIYWRAGFALAVGTEVYGLCAGYIRISPY